MLNGRLDIKLAHYVNDRCVKDPQNRCSMTSTNIVMYIDVKIFEDSGSPQAPQTRPDQAQWCRRGDLLNVIPSHKISSPRPRTEDRGIAAVQENSVMSWPRLLFYAWFDLKRSLKCHRFYGRGHQSLVMFSTERVLDNIYICCVASNLLTRAPADHLAVKTSQ